VQYCLGSAYRHSGSIDLAIEHLQKAIALRRDFGPPHESLAMALYENGDYRGAWKEAEIARRLGCPPDPKFMKALDEHTRQP
jgi:tetratricopeptide (TPR) repeat protein